MNERLSLIVSSRHRYPMKSRQTQSWLRPGELLARLFLPPDDDRAASLQSIFRFDSAEIWRLGQQRRSRYLATLLHRKSNKTAVDAPDGVSGRTQRGPTAPRQQSYLWTAVLIVGAIAACAIAAWFYVDVSLLDASMVGH
jgi:hypothetical protein